MIRPLDVKTSQSHALNKVVSLGLTNRFIISSYNGCLINTFKTCRKFAKFMFQEQFRQQGPLGVRFVLLLCCNMVELRQLYD